MSIVGQKIMKPLKINFKDKFSKFPNEDYAVRIVAMMNNYEIKIVKRKGESIWHSHPDTDETFIILDGKMQMNFRDKVVELNSGEMIVVPKGVEHKPSSEEGYRAILIEPAGVSNTGDIDSAFTIKKAEWI
jgi:mannose-6-phosphate isomerase-like protein (cupin superfamily)